MLTKGDKILIIILVLLSVFIFILTSINLTGFNIKTALIKVNGKTYKEINLTENMRGKEIEIETEYGYNLLEIGDGDIKVVDASCPDKLDVKQGSISKPGEIIVCLPNRLTIEIIGKNEEDEIDYLLR